LLRKFRLRMVNRSSEFWRQVVAVLLGLLAGVKALHSMLGASAWFGLGCLALGALSIAGLRFAAADEKKRGPLMVKSPEELVVENIKWLGEQGHVVLVTNDMSWVEDPSLDALVDAKSKAQDLTVIASRRTTRFEAWESAGARLIIVPNVPRVRFAILRYKAPDSRVLITRQIKGDVAVFELVQADFPTFNLCMDLVDAYLHGHHDRPAPKGRGLRRPAP
jgi:hypothetical protein